ncbi:MAG TPA: hypothetical protein VHP81_09490 [Lachnospiraceae bacterium]|nr:hypothetical protein [Lachnospiraceae bacterium]
MNFLRLNKARTRWIAFILILTVTLTGFTVPVKAATSGTLTLSVTDPDLDYSQTSITRTVGGQDFTLTGGEEFGGLAFDAGGIYANEDGGNSCKLTITIKSGYMFNLDKLEALAQAGNFNIAYTLANGSTGSINKTGISTSGTLSISNVVDVELSNLTQIVLSSTEYAVFNNFELSEIQLIPALPTATTDSASNITANSASLNGTVNDQNSSTEVSFEYGISTGYGSTVTATQSPLSGLGTSSVSASLSSLTPNTTYHYRVVAMNATGTTLGSDQTFTTPSLPVSSFSYTSSTRGRPVVFSRQRLLNYNTGCTSYSCP